MIRAKPLLLARRGKVPPPFPPHVAEKVKEARALHDLVREQGRDGAAGIVQGERGIARMEYLHETSDPDSVPASRIGPEATPGEEPPHAEG